MGRFPSAVQIVTFNRSLDKRNYSCCIFLTRGLQMRRKYNLEASALQPVQHCAFAYTVGMNWIHATGKRTPRIDAAAIIPQERADFISELIESNLEAIPSQRKEMNRYASTSCKRFKTTLLLRRDGHAEFLADKMTAAFTTLYAAP